ncbi:MAG TPA: aldehyde ferredoxin oxidoreductase family protein [Firmicutes bacterium]|nr:aldehyde ferredoxin oxidoreductase family protein [Bacillota bacterium]
MGHGYQGKVLKVDLSERSIRICAPGQSFYRRYMGGSAWGAYFLLKELRPGIDPLGPENLLVVAPSVVTGVPISGFSRFNLTAKSPLTGAIGDTQAGGWFGPELKAAGFDAVVVGGQADVPVYLWIHDGICEIKNAAELWGLETGDVETRIRNGLGDRRVRVISIGPGGENLVRYACVLSEGKFAAGRTGMGAVMGSKRLKAIAVRGTHPPDFFDPERLRTIAKEVPARLKANPGISAVSMMGSAMGVTWQQAEAGLPTRNFSSGVFDAAYKLGGEHIYRTIHTGRRDTCFACGVHCKQVVAARDPYTVDPYYGAPEYESLAALGSYVGVGDTVTVCKAAELCNRYGLDTISVGASIAFAMECYERELITKADTDGLDLRFGNGSAVLRLIEMIAYRRGLGDLLAEGLQAAVEKVGPESAAFALHAKGNPFPAHMPRVKRSLGLAYAVVPFGADHVSSEHDPVLAPTAPPSVKERYHGLGLYDEAEPSEMNYDKVRFFYYTQMLFSIFDTLEVCIRAFSIYDLPQLDEIVRAATGWKTTFFELMKVGERRFNMLRCFNAREGFTREHDKLPARMWEALRGGESEGLKMSPEELEWAKNAYYGMAGWDPMTGNPTAVKLHELGIGWAGGVEDRPIRTG